MKNRKKTNTVARLSFAALALPGLMQTATAGRTEEDYSADFQYGHYQESNRRMNVDVFDGALSAPIGKSMTANVGILRDIIAGASPTHNERDPVTGRIHQVISQASTRGNWCGQSICEQRDQITGGLTYFMDKASVNLGGGFSREQDYTSRFFNTNVSIDLNKKLTTLNFGGSMAFDIIQPSPGSWGSDTTQGGGQGYWPYGYTNHKTSQNYLVGISQILDKNSILQSNVTFGYSDGFLTDPYKKIFVDDGLGKEGSSLGRLNEKRPGHRFEWALLEQYVRHFDKLNNAALHADYRFSSNDWGVDSHTFEVSWHQPIVDDWQIIPKIRYYSQTKANFYQPTFLDPWSTGLHLDNYSYYSSDYRLAGFGAISGGLKLSKEIKKIKHIDSLKFQTGFEYYNHNAGYEIGSNNNQTFDSFSYTMVTASFNLKF
ncbi:MAG: DUF3570 domain-containing protein [Methylobacter sp.]|nr:DUF3570 domain-containing protein [Methylobacter sp.]